MQFVKAIESGRPKAIRIDVSTNCKNHFTPNCFKILDSAKNTYTLKLKETIYIQNRKPELSTQI